MDQSYSESDVSLSPSQVLERLQVLRQLQLMQRGKLHKQRLQYQGSPETANSVTDIINQFSNSTSYNTFRSLLQSSLETPSITVDTTPRDCNISQKVKERDLIEGVSVLNVSQESELITYTPTSIQSSILESPEKEKKKSNSNVSDSQILASKKHILLDEMPILSPKKDFEALVLEKIQKESKTQKTTTLVKNSAIENKTTSKPFLKKGEGMARFGLNKNKVIIQKTQALPWLCKKANNCNPPRINKKIQNDVTNVEKMKVQIIVSEPKKPIIQKKSLDCQTKVLQSAKQTDEVTNKQITIQANKHSDSEAHSTAAEPLHKSINISNYKHPLLLNKGKTWAAVLTKEQDDFLRQLKQSEYYKNFVSPSKSTVSDISCNENLYQIRQERELAEQNMFELLENKVTNESFNTESSFIKRFLRKSKLECSGESTPLIMQRCLDKNPYLMHIYPDLTHKKRNENSHSDTETCNSEYTDCCSETCSSASSCSTCKTVDHINNTQASLVHNAKKDTGQKVKKLTGNKNEKKVTVGSDNKDLCQNNEPDDTIKNNMVEMNAKLVATSELLKDRLHELEDEIETFRKENSNLAKLREEIDLERQKFYAEKSAFEQKFNEEKILSEYYLAEEKEKLTKQKQTYDRYLREMRGQLNKKDKDEVTSYKKEINDLKDEIRLKDAKSTSTIARLRNQIKLMEKEKIEMKDEIEKLKKEIRKIQHSNDMTRRLTNIKYLEEINKKLSTMTTSNTKTNIELDNNSNYKAFEIQRQSRSRTIKSKNKNSVRPRAKSVPNLNVTSRYAKYFSQRDIQSEIDQKQQVDVVHYTNCSNSPLKLDNMLSAENESSGDESFQEKSDSDKEDDNHIENLYLKEFHNIPLRENRSKINNLSANQKFTEEKDCNDNSDSFFIRPSTTPVSILSNRSSNSRKSPTIITNHSLPSTTSMPLKSGFQKSSILGTENDLMTVSPEPSVITPSVRKTSLNPTEILKPDGSKEIRFPNGNVKYISNDGDYSKFVYYNGDIKENFYNEGRIKYFYAETKTYHTTHADGLEVLEFSDGQIEKRYKDGSSEIRLPNGSIRYLDPKNEHVREEWRFPDGAALTVSANGEQRIVFSNGQIEVHAKDHKRREFPDGTMKLVYNDGTSETRYASGRVRIKDKHGNLIMDSANT